MLHFALNRNYGVYRVLSVVKEDIFKVSCDECEEISILSGDKLFRCIEHCQCKASKDKSRLGEN